MIGRVVSVKMQKSAVVLVEAHKKHPLYGKIYLRTKKYLVDDPFKVKDGDVVEIIKVKPISKNKHYQIKKVLGSDIVSIETAQLQASAKEAIEEVLPEKEVEEVVVKEEIKEEIKKPVKTTKITKKVTKKEKKNGTA